MALTYPSCFPRWREPCHRWTAFGPILHGKAIDRPAGLANDRGMLQG
jgi:hypothetical protein